MSAPRRPPARYTHSTTSTSGRVPTTTTASSSSLLSSSSPPSSSPEAARTPSSRIPTKAPGASEGKSKAAQHVSRLAKRASRSVAPSEKVAVAPSAKAAAPAAMAPAPTPTARDHHHPRVTRKDAAVPPRKDSAVSSRKDSAVSSRKDSAVSSRKDSAVSSRKDSAVSSHKDSVLPPSETSMSASVSAPSKPSIPVPKTAYHHHGSSRMAPPPPPPVMRTPSLVSGSSASTFDSPRSAPLRRKPSTLDRYAVPKNEDTALRGLASATMHSRREGYHDALDDTVLGVALPPAPPAKDAFGHPPSTAPAHAPADDREWLAPRNSSTTPPVQPGSTRSATPSTRYTDSPFSHVPTPSSMSSYSPAVVATSGPTPTPPPHQPSLNHDRSRPPISSRRTADRVDGAASRLALPPVRESSTSSSNSTARPPSSKSAASRKEIPRKTSASAPPPGTTPSAVSRSSSRAKPSSTAAAGPPPRVPPELAHLNVEPTLSQASLHKPLPPLRPSRDNTPSLTDMNKPAPVVQSDLPRLYTTYHKRTSSQETPLSPSAPAPSPGPKSRLGRPSSRSSSRQASPRVDSAISPPLSARGFAPGPTPEVPSQPPPTQPKPPAQPRESRRLRRKDSPAIGPAPSPSKSPRFSLFSRKPKADAPPKLAERPKRQPTKGPAAGTGHEGYGRFGFRGRSGSTTSSADFRSPSTDSNASSVPSHAAASRKGSFGSSNDGPELDDFLRERLTPVVLRGSSSTFSANGSSVSDAPAAPIVPDHASSSSSLDSYPQPRLLPSAMHEERGLSPVKRPTAARHRLPSESSEDDASTRYVPLAVRRSHDRLSQVNGHSSPTRVPPRIAPQEAAPSGQSRDHDDTHASAWPQTGATAPGTDDPFQGKEGLWLRPLPPPATKPAKKWNFFQRAQASPRPKGKERAGSSPESTRAGAAHRGPHRTMAQYAMLDSVEPVDLYEVQQYVQENETSLDESTSDEQATRRVVPYERRHSTLLPSPPVPDYGPDSAFRAKPTLPRFTVRHNRPESRSPELTRAPAAAPPPAPVVVQNPRPASAMPPGTDGLPDRRTPDGPSDSRTPEMPSTSFDPLENRPDSTSPRQSRLSRLSSIGRIPQVVSKRDREYKSPDYSFSRPFVRAPQHPPAKPPGALYNQIRSSRELTSPLEPGSQPVSSTSTRSDRVSAERKGSSSVNTNAPSVSTTRTSTDLHGGGEFLAFPPRKGSEVSYSSSSGNGSWYATMAAQPPQEDDHWAEYDDLVNDMLPGALRKPVSTSSSLGAPFQYAHVLYDPNSPSAPTPLNFAQPPTAELPAPPRANAANPANTTTTVLSVPQQVAHFMRPSLSPLRPYTTLSELVDHYGNRSTSTLASAGRLSLPPPARASLSQPHRASMPDARGSMSSLRHSRGSAHSRSASLPEANNRHSQLSLSSHAHFNRDTQLLDIAECDDDEQAFKTKLRLGALMTSKWLSFGRVLFSPAHHEMRLSDDPRVLVIDGLGSDWSYYVALTYSAATVYNLGPTPADGALPGFNQKPPPNHRHNPHSAISGAFPFPKGFFTAVVVRFPIATTDQAYYACISECKRVLRPGGHLEVSLLDLDLTNMGARARNLVRGLKTRMQQRDPTVSLRNLSDLIPCLIGKRGFENLQRCVVGVPAAGHIPRSGDISSVSSGHSGDRSGRHRRRVDSIGKEFTFAGLLENARSSQVDPMGSDEGITKMVAKVGRWWYSTCYETPLLQTDKSIWKDNGLLRECEKQGTSFRLFICCAQKPNQTRRRTVSV